MATKTVEEIVTAFRLINTAKISKMEPAEKLSFLRAVRQLKKTSDEFDDALKDAQTRLKPDGFDAIEPKIQSGEQLPPEETAIVDQFNRELTEFINAEAKRTVDLTFEPLTEEAFNRFVDSNDFAVKDVLVASEVLL